MRNSERAASSQQMTVTFKQLARPRGMHLGKLCARFAGLFLGVAAASCGAHRTFDFAPAPDPAPVDPTADTRAAVRAELAAHRRLQVARLHAYAQAGVFPRNTKVAPTGHFFRDAGGRLCAVANLVHQDGRDDLVDAVVRTKNDLVIDDVHDGALYDWILSSGLTQEELARIQRPAPIMMPPPAKTGDPFAAWPLPTLAPLVPGAKKKLPTEAEVRADLQAQLAAIEAQVISDTDASLDAAVERLLATRGAHRV
jgi:hypothetical protein